jgi:hypothetical protein
MTRKFGTLLVIVSFAMLVFAFAGCGGDDNSASGDTTATETTTTETTETETTETETTDTTETETTETTETTDLSDFATSANCKEFRQIGTKLSAAFTGGGTEDLQEVKQYFNDLVAAAPDEIKGDFQTIADAYGKIADALKGYDPSSGQPPSASQLAKLQQLSTSLDQAKLTQAGQNISKWAQENCT